MFNFMKKSTSGATGDSASVVPGSVPGIALIDDASEKERRKKEKKERKDKKRERNGSGVDEPHRLEEHVRRSLKLRRKKEKEKLPSGITADYTDTFFAHLERDTTNYSNLPLTTGSTTNLSDDNNLLSPNYNPTSNWKEKSILQSDSSETSLNSLNNPNVNSSRQPPNLPPVPPRPPKRGILKGSRLSNASSNSQEPEVELVNGQDPNVLMRNTLQNEMISYNIPKSSSSNDDLQMIQSFTKKVIHSPLDGQIRSQGNFLPPKPRESTKLNGAFGVNSTSPSAGSLTDTTTNSSFATPPFSTSPVGESQGFQRWSKTNFEDVYLPLPEVTPVTLPKPRILTIQRQKPPRTDFGFSLRIAMILDTKAAESVKINGHSNLEDNGYNSGDGGGKKTENTLKTVVLAEPGSSAKSSSETGLLPGDRLLEVNGVTVEGKTREQIIDLIKTSQDSVTIKVQPIAELSELSVRRAADGACVVELPDADIRSGTLRRSGSRRFNKAHAKSEEQLATEQEWLATSRLWLAHRGGYTAVRREGSGESGKVTVKVEATGEVIEVDEDDLEKANPASLERCEDVATLRCLTECSALHTLRSRLSSGLYYCRAGHATIMLGPPPASAPIHTDKVASMFRGCRAEDMPPHIYATAQATHRSMLAERRDRAIVFLGRSGSGKTTAMKHSVWYLAKACAAPNTKLTPEKFEVAFEILEAFGNCRTPWSQNTTRFLGLYSLDFDGVGSLVSASVQTLLHDLRPSRENTFHALTWLIHGCDARLRRELHLEQSGAANPYVSAPPLVPEPGAAFSSLTRALGVAAPQHYRSICSVLAAIAHLGWAGCAKATSGGTSRQWQWAEAGSAERAAKLLGTTRDMLTQAVFGNDVSGLRTPSPSNDREYTGLEMLDAFANGLYSELFNVVVALVNKYLASSTRSTTSIILIDSPGTYNPLSAGHQSGTDLYKLMSNYIQERLQATFHESMLVAPRERYAQEGIVLAGEDAQDDWLSESVNPGPMVELLDRAPQNAIVRTSQMDLRDCDKRGLLWLLEEESMYPGSSDETFLERVFTHASGQHQLIKKAPPAKQFILNHMQGTNPVLYDVNGWVKASKENPVGKRALPLLQESQNEEISTLFTTYASSHGPTDSSTLRRASSIRRPFTPGGGKRRSVALQARWAGDALADVIRRSNARYVCCFQASTRGGVNVPLLRSQFRGFQLLDAVRLYKQGFPEHMPLSEFARRYRLLSTEEDKTEKKEEVLSDRQAVDDMLITLDLDTTSYRLGVTQIFFRPGVVASLDARRDAAIGRVLVRLQARARGLLARRRATKLRTQHTAARCIQRNVRTFMDVRDWAWWRLLVRITPLLAVHRTEERLKCATDEVEAMRAKVEKLEAERAHLKAENDRLENKLSECNGELCEERSAAASATERAEAEAAERLRVEKEARELAANNEKLQQTSERLELELLHWRSASETAGLSDSEADSGDGEAAERYKKRYERVARELQLVKTQLRRQHEDDLEQLVMVKKQLEKKVADAFEEVEEQRSVAAQWKRKVHKLTNDMADLRSLLDEQTCRNNLLEKRQRKFDSELATLNEELRKERANRERLSAERESLVAEKSCVEQTIQDLKLELDLKEERIASLTRELEESGGAGGGEGELNSLRKAKAQLERKLRDQEEELEDLAGQIQLLESSKLRLEMSLEQQRKEARLEAVQRDDELEETRANHAKKIKMLECQLESEHSERTLLLRERHELERRLATLEDVARSENQEQTQLIQRLKRDLKRYRALLRDAQTMLEQKEKEGGSKAQIRQLKNQVEELEVSLRASTKAKCAAEAEASEANSALDEATRAKAEAAERANRATRELAGLKSQLDDAEDEMQELMTKYRTSTTQLVNTQALLREAENKAELALEEIKSLKDKLNEANAKLARQSQGNEAVEVGRRLELRTKELESSLELEQTSRARLEAQLTRARDQHDKLATEANALRLRLADSDDLLRKLNKQLRDAREEIQSLHSKLDESQRLKVTSEASLAATRAELATARDEARLASRRAAALHDAIHADLSSTNNSPDSESDNDSYSSDESIETFLANHKLSPRVPSRSISQQVERSTESRQSISSNTSPKLSSGRESRA